jgi:hypothetical protein
MAEKASLRMKKEPADGDVGKGRRTASAKTLWEKCSCLLDQ